MSQAEYVKNCGIKSCCDPEDPQKLHPAIADLWKKCLPPVPGTDISLGPDLATPTKTPDPNNWHKNFVMMVDKYAEEGGRLPSFVRHIAEEAALVYPDVEHVDGQYIDHLKTPEGTHISFDQLFELVQRKVKTAWGDLGSALGNNGGPGEFALANGCLDTGRDDTGATIYWKEAIT